LEIWKSAINEWLPIKEDYTVLTNMNVNSFNFDKDLVVFSDEELKPKGACRAAYEGYYRKSNHVLKDVKVVVKHFRKFVNTNNANIFKTEQKIANIAHHFVDKWNLLEIGDQIDLVIPKTVKIPFNKEEKICFVEPFLDGKWTKWNRNGQGVKETHESIHAFCHWTYYVSCGHYLYCDAQGIKKNKMYILTDPCILSYNEKLGLTDIGEVGTESWFTDHKCNKFCDQWKKMYGKNEHEFGFSAHEPKFCDVCKNKRKNELNTQKQKVDDLSHSFAKITFEENKNQNNNSADYSEDQHCHNHYYDSKHCHYTHNNYDDNDDNDDNDDPMFETNGKKYYVGSAGGIYSLTPSKNKSYVTGNKKKHKL